MTDQDSVRLAGVLMALEGSKETEGIKRGDYAWSLALERARRLREVYNAVAGEAIVWRREDGGENKLAIAIANVRGEEGKT